MKGTRNIFLLVLGAIILILFVWGCSGYNGLVKKDESVKNMWANVQSSYQRRADLIPNLVNTAADRQKLDCYRRQLSQMRASQAELAAIDSRYPGNLGMQVAEKQKLIMRIELCN